MPIEQPTQNTAPVFYPKENYKIARYMDLSKFISLLYSQSFFFCRLDKLEDKFEGVLPNPSLIYLKKYYEKVYDEFEVNSKTVNEYVDENLSGRKEIAEKFKALNCISCWNVHKSESYALWKIYSGIDKGIMITSNIELLNKSFEKTDEVIQLSEVKYIDHERDFIPTGNLNDCIIHKNKAYYYEEEIRLIYCLLGTGKVGNGLVYDWDTEPLKSGKYIKANLEILIDEIVLSPYASTWFYAIIQDLLQKYNLDKKIRFSNLKTGI